MLTARDTLAETSLSDHVGRTSVKCDRPLQNERHMSYMSAVSAASDAADTKRPRSAAARERLRYLVDPASSDMLVLTFALVGGAILAPPCGFSAITQKPLELAP